MRVIIILSCFLTFGFSSTAQSQEQVYAGVILHIMKYVEWPAYKSKMTVGVVNNPSLVRALQKASVGKKVHFKNVLVTVISDLPTGEKMDVLFFSKKVSKGLSIESLKGTNGTLIITEQHTQINGSVSFNFIQKNGSLQFELYNDALAGNGFKVSDQLKKLAILK
jgi:hypothetical protein